MPLSTSVDSTIDTIAHRFQGDRGAEAVAQLRSTGAYQDQLLVADPCLDRFLDLELDPAAPAPVGGEGRVALGTVLRPDDERAEALRDSLAVTMTGSYLTMIGIEQPVGSEFVKGRGSEELWRFWIDHMRSTATLAFGVPGKLVGSVRTEGGALLESEIKRLGLMPGPLRRRGISGRCGSIAVYGLVLRLGQTALCDDASFDEAQNTEKVQDWPFRANG